MLFVYRTKFAARSAINDLNEKWWVVMNSLQPRLCEPAKMGSKILCLNGTLELESRETMKSMNHFDRNCEQWPRNRHEMLNRIFARIRAAIAGAKGTFEQKRFCPESGTWQRKSCGNVNHEQIRILFGFVDIT